VQNCHIIGYIRVKLYGIPSASSQEASQEACFSAGLVKGKGLCQSSVVPDREGVDTNLGCPNSNNVGSAQPYYPWLLRMLVEILDLLPTSPALLQRKSDHVNSATATSFSFLEYGAINGLGCTFFDYECVG